MNRNIQNGPSRKNAAAQPEWKEIYLRALREDDPKELLDRVLAAETAIVERLRALRISSEAGPGRDAEQVELAEASRALLLMKNSKLNFPDWTSSRETEGERCS